MQCDIAKGCKAIFLLKQIVKLHRNLIAKCDWISMEANTFHMQLLKWEKLLFNVITTDSIGVSEQNCFITTFIHNNKTMTWINTTAVCSSGVSVFLFT